MNSFVWSRAKLSFMYTESILMHL